MKLLFWIPLAGLAILIACEKDETMDVWPKPSKLLITIRENNRVITEFQYDDQERLIQINNYPADTIVEREFYQYDEENRLARRVFNGGIETYAYNPDGKLKTVHLNFDPSAPVRTTSYQYRGDRIIRGIIHYGGTFTGYIEYHYDLNGNTIRRVEYYDEMMMSEYRLAYDNKINPVRNLSKFPVDMVQKNNPTCSYYYIAFMSFLPPEYCTEYAYDSAELPVLAYAGSRTFEYEYASRQE